MNIIRTLAWAPQKPRRVDSDTREVRDVAAWVAKNTEDAHAWGVCLLMTDVTSKPSRLLRYYSEASGEGGTACVTALRLRAREAGN